MLKSCYNVTDKSEITPSEYLATLRVLHILLKRQAKSIGSTDLYLRETLSLVEQNCSDKLGNIINLLYDS